MANYPFSFRKFRKFMQNNRSWDSFKKEFYMSDLNRTLLDLSRNVSPPASYLSSAFIWATSEKGYNYWAKLHLKWIKEASHR